jgi:hypothetical protein
MERRLVAPRVRVPLAEGRNTGDPDVVRGTGELVLVGRHPIVRRKCEQFVFGWPIGAMG